MSQDTPTDPQVLRAEIEQTRAELGETVAELAARTDVKARTREAASNLTRRARAIVTSTWRLSGSVLGLVTAPARALVRTVRGPRS